MEAPLLDRDLDWRDAAVGMQQSLANNLIDLTGNVSTCPICDSIESEHYVTVYDYPYALCSSCNHIYLQKVLNKTSLANLYSGNPDKLLANQESVYLDENYWNARVKSITQPKFEFIKSVAESVNIEINNLLDVGSGGGEMLQVCKLAGIKCSGLESDLSFVISARNKGHEVIQGYFSSETIKKLNYKPEIVTMINIIEHLERPRDTFEIIRKMKPLILAFEVPRHPSISSIVPIIFKDQTYRHIYPPDHLHIFSERSIEILCQLADVEIIGKWEFGQDVKELFDAILSNIPSTVRKDYTSLLTQSGNKIQSQIDDAGLSDTVLIVAKNKL